MMRCLIGVAGLVLLSTGLCLPLDAQEDVAVEMVDAANAVLAASAFYEAHQDTDSVRSDLMVPILLSFGIDSSLSATDGNYLAQNQLELQTYYDLGLTYQYIAEPYLRQQLKLPNEQGIIIVSADQSDEGFRNGFQHGDIVLLVDDEPVDTQYDFVIALSQDRGTQRSARILRNGEVMDLIVVMSEAEIQQDKRWIIGVFVDEISEVTKTQLGLEGGTAVTSTSEDGPAARVGVLEHDIITHIDGTLINSLDDLKEIVGSSDGRTLQLSMIRAGKKVSVEVQPNEVPLEKDGTSVVSQLYADRFVRQRAVDLLVDFSAVAADASEPEDRLKQLEQQVECLQKQVQELLDASKR